jgi:antitoxin HicB
MLAYPCRFTPASEWDRADTGFVVTCRDLDGVVTEGETMEEAAAMAEDAIATVLSSMRGTAGWPSPSPAEPGEVLVVLPPLLAAKAALWASMKDQGVSRSELARRLGVDEKELRRLLSFGHRSRMDRLEAALRALGKRLVVEVREAA